MHEQKFQLITILTTAQIIYFNIWRNRYRSRTSHRRYPDPALFPLFLIPSIRIQLYSPPTSSTHIEPFSCDIRQKACLSLFLLSALRLYLLQLPHCLADSFIFRYPLSLLSKNSEIIPSLRNIIHSFPAPLFEFGPTKFHYDCTKKIVGKAAQGGAWIDATFLPRWASSPPSLNASKFLLVRQNARHPHWITSGRHQLRFKRCSTRV